MIQIDLETLELENFKCHKNKMLFFTHTKMQILGAGSTGKTSIQDAWCWLLFGKDSRGSTLSEVRPLDKNGKIQHPWAETRVTAVFLVSRGKTAIPDEEMDQMQFCRRYYQTEEGKWVYGFQLDGMECSRKEFEQRVKSIFDENLFWVLSFPDFFPEKTNIREKTAILDSILGDGEKDLSGYARLKEAAGETPLGKFCLELEKNSQPARNRDLPARISEMEGTLRQMGVLDFSSMEIRKDCLFKRRQRLQKEGPSPALTALDQEISQLDQSLGQKTMVKSCGDRLTKLRKEQETILRNQRTRRALQKEADKWLMLHLGILEEAEKVFLKDGLRLDFHPMGKTPGCRILRHGIPYESLSRQEQVRAQLGILQFLSLILETRYPVFLDNWQKNPLLEDFFGQYIALCRDQREGSLVMNPWQ